MARTAARKSKTNFIVNWASEHPEEIRIGAIAAAVAFFFTHGLPLWDDDYSQWLQQANGSFFDLVLRILLPFTNEPMTWGYSDRPLQVLLYKVFGLFFGTWGTGYFFIKSLAFGALSGTLYHSMRQLGVDRRNSTLAVALFAFSTNALAAVIWHSDFSVYSQLILANILLWALPRVQKGTHDNRFLVTFGALVYFGSKVKGDVRLAPLVLLAYLWLFRREKIKAYAAPFAGVFALTLPWSTQMFKHLPPFLGGAGYQGWTYGTFSLGRVIEFLLGDFFTLRTAPLSLLGSVGIFVVIGLVAYGGYRIYRENLESPDEKNGFYLVWLAVALLASGILAPQNRAFELRYTLMALVPATVLIGLFFQAIARDFARQAWAGPALAAIVAVQCSVHAFHDYQHRRDMGHTMVAVDKIYRQVEDKYPNAQLLFGQGFLNYGYKNVQVPAIANRKVLGSEDVSRYPVNNSYVVSWNSTLDPRMSMAFEATGCTTSLFDAIFSCNPGEGAVLLRYVGPLGEVAQADQLDRQGNLPAARQAIEPAYQRDPDNHGVAFVVGLYAYRAGDYAKMEQVYDRMGPYFGGHTSVVYNWGLAKQGQQKFSEAARLFEKAYSMAPKDYAIGFNLADAYYRQGRKPAAIRTLDDLIKVYPNAQPLKNSRDNWSK